MKIGEVAMLAGLPAKTIRYYESIGLIGEPARTSSSYREYADGDVHRLRFLRRARTLGFSIDQCRELLALQHDQRRASADVRAVARRHVEELSARLRELESMRGALEGLVRQCHGDDRPECPILETLSRDSAADVPADGAGEVAQRYLDAFYGGDAARVREVVTEDVVYSAPGATYAGVEAFLKAAAHVGPSTLRYEVQRMFVDGDDVSVFHVLHVRHAVGRFPLAERYTVRADRIATIHVLFDTAPFMRPARKDADAVVDPVCGMTVDREAPPATASHRGKTVYFCSPGCAEAFTRHPDEYAPAS